MLALALMSPTAEAKKKKSADKPKQEQVQKNQKDKKQKKVLGIFKKKKKQQQPAAPQQKPAPKPSVDRKGMFQVQKVVLLHPRLTHRSRLPDHHTLHLYARRQWEVRWRDAEPADGLLPTRR